MPNQSVPTQKVTFVSLLPAGSSRLGAVSKQYPWWREYNTPAQASYATGISEDSIKGALNKFIELNALVPTVTDHQGQGVLSGGSCKSATCYRRLY